MTEDTPGTNKIGLAPLFGIFAFLLVAGLFTGNSVVGAALRLSSALLLGRIIYLACAKITPVRLLFSLFGPVLYILALGQIYKLIH